MDALVRLHPGWRGVAQYDEALARLTETAARTPLTTPSANGLTALPPTAGDTPVAPQLALERGRLRLESVERDQIAHLHDRQARNRERQVALRKLVWERDAGLEYIKAVGAAQTAFSQKMSLLAADQNASRLNLILQIRALKKIISGWDASKPPTPELDQARRDLQQKQAQFAELTDTRQQSEKQAIAAREASIRAAAQARDASVSSLVAAEETRLRAQDERQVVALKEQLGAQRDALLRQERLLSAAPVSAAGPLGAQNLPSETPLATTAPGAGHSFRSAAAMLRDQRSRWIAFLYSDTRAAAQDAATQKHWIVTYGGPVPGQRNLTAPLAQALTARVWKT